MHFQRRVAALTSEQRALLARRLEEAAAAQEGGGRCLVAYVVPAPGRPGQALQAAELRHFLGSKLPDYMVPAAFPVLAALPLAANGKIDRRALPAPDWGSQEPAGEATPPRDALEEALAAVWQEVLGGDRLGVHDDFFDLGGDSILSLRISAVARERGLAVTPGKIYEHPTIAGLAAVLGAEAGDGEAARPEGLAG